MEVVKHIKLALIRCKEVRWANSKVKDSIKFEQVTNKVIRVSQELFFWRIVGLIGLKENNQYVEFF